MAPDAASMTAARSRCGTIQLHTICIGNDRPEMRARLSRLKLAEGAISVCTRALCSIPDVQIYNRLIEPFRRAASAVSIQRNGACSPFEQPRRANLTMLQPRPDQPTLSRHGGAAAHKGFIRRKPSGYGSRRIVLTAAGAPMFHALPSAGTNTDGRARSRAADQIGLG